jgi:hypothetical protein
MWIQKISKQNLTEILVLPLIFILVFLAGISIFIIFDQESYMLYAGWCFTTGFITIIVIGVYTYLRIKAKY